VLSDPALRVDLEGDVPTLRIDIVLAPLLMLYLSSEVVRESLAIMGKVFSCCLPFARYRTTQLCLHRRWSGQSQFFVMLAEPHSWRRVLTLG
jgi:hypothetical protein